MGSSQSIEHDPGAEGPSGEGETAVTAMILCHIFTIICLFRAQLFPQWFAKDKKNSVKEPDAEAGVTKVEMQTEKVDAPVIKVEDTKTELSDKAEGGDAPPATDLAQAIAAMDEDQKAMLQWTEPEDYEPAPWFRRNFIWLFTCGSRTEKNGDNDWVYKASGVNYPKIAGTLFVVWMIWVFLVCLGVMGTGFKLLGGKDSARMFDVVDNPISGVMVGVLATVLVQSSSTSTSIIIGMVGADEMSVSTAVPMVMGANIGTSVTNTLVAMGHFHDPAQLRRGFAGATVHDCFNLLTVAVLLPIQWASNFLGHISYAIAKDADACDEDTEGCEKVEFVKPYIKPYIGGVAKYDKNVAKYVTQGYCKGQCGDSPSHEELAAVSALVCDHESDDKLDCRNIDGYRSSWMENDHELKKKRMPEYILFENDDLSHAKFLYGCPADMSCDDLVIGNMWNRTSNEPLGLTYTANSDAGMLVSVCQGMKHGLCDKRLLKGGLMLEDWKLSDEEAGGIAVWLSISCLCCVIYLIVQTLQILVKGAAARFIQRSIGANGYVSMLIGMVITILVQSSSITTSTLTPLVAVGIIRVVDMFPLTLGANIGTTITGIMAASVVTSNPVEAWQVAICHLLFNILGILIWYPIPYMRKIPLGAAEKLGECTVKYGRWFPVVYTGIVFFGIPGIAYGITVAATG